jgi:hypothetical protein
MLAFLLFHVDVPCLHSKKAHSDICIVKSHGRYFAEIETSVLNANHEKLLNCHGGKNY